MEAVIGHTHRRLLAFSSTSLCSFHGKCPSFGRLSIHNRVKLHHNSLLKERDDRNNELLSLSSFALNCEVETPKKEKTFSPRKSNIALRVSSDKIKRTMKSSVEIQAPFAAKSFFELGISSLLIKQLEKEGLNVPTEVQCAAIPTIIKKHDVVIQSYTGSGKTLAYLLPILSLVGPLKEPNDEEEVEFNPKHGIEAVIIAPSRELGMQIVREVERLLGPPLKRFVQQLVGGANRSRQEEALKKNKPLIVVGTPGRIAEISAAGKLHTHGCRFLVLDEVDELLSFNYREDMHRILEHVGRKPGAASTIVLGPLAKWSERQTIMVSATVPFSIVRAARSWGTNPLLVRAKCVVSLDSISASGVSSIASASATKNSVTQAAIGSLPPGLNHYYCVSKAQHKIDTLRRCIHALDAKMVIVFMNHTKPLKDLVFKLEARGIKAAELHGNLSKLLRTTTLKNFKDGNIRVLATNELSARGLDVPDCDLIVNLDLPTDSVHYAHRAGRTGRLGRKGTVVTMCEEPEVFVVKKLRRQLGLGIQLCELSEGRLVACKEEEDDKAEAVS
ncbi:DEAD-box ATP-dependent RNA helicase 47B-like [Phalaenopsis equestris]|uniref:DEAD-box ATP-dependent RNA helicase 47B-like n=1 Tax=Phalaenopsis equestris TaxID=78828 RepID=UPI0009E65469|nr:DEAD-box ATP-dependent RNA helicase 47B-like [Phalaenopsis equestris]